MHRLIPKGFDIRLSRDGSRAVILIIESIEGDRTMIPIDSHTADEVGRQILAGALALNGALR